MVHCIGIGPGEPSWLTLRARDLIAGAEVVAGFDAVVNFVRPHIAPGATVITMGYKDQVEKLAEMAVHHHAGKKCAVVFMGDVHFSGFQFWERVERACGHRVESVPGISSAQVLASRARVCFDETTFITFHRRGDIEPFKKHLASALEVGRNAIVIPLPWSFMPKDIAADLVARGIPPQHKIEVWENLSREEASWHGTLGECTRDFSDMSILVIRALEPMPTGLEGEP